MIERLASLIPLEAVGHERTSFLLWIFLSLLRKKNKPAESHFPMVYSFFQVDHDVTAKSQVESRKVYFAGTVNTDSESHGNQNVPMRFFSWIPVLQFRKSHFLHIHIFCCPLFKIGGGLICRTKHGWWGRSYSRNRGYWNIALERDGEEK